MTDGEGEAERSVSPGSIFKRENRKERPRPTFISFLAASFRLTGVREPEEGAVSLSVGCPDMKVSAKNRRSLRRWLEL